MSPTRRADAPLRSDRVQAVAVAVGARVLRALPEALALGLGWGLGWVAGSLLRIRRRTIDDNLARAFPGRSPRWRRRVAARVLPHIVREAVTVIRMAGEPPERLLGRIRFEGLELLERAVAERRGAVVATGHFGNWEIGGGAVALEGLPLDVVVQRQSNPLLDARLRATREALGMRVVYRHEAPKRVLRALRQGRVVALVADQNVLSGGIFVDFFGTPASTARGPALFALRTGAVFLLGTALRLPGARARYRVRFQPLEAPSTGESDLDARALTRRYLAALEEVIGEAPEQYFWPHKRWKTRPAGEGVEEPQGAAPV